MLSIAQGLGVRVVGDVGLCMAPRFFMNIGLGKAAGNVRGAQSPARLSRGPKARDGEKHRINGAALGRCGMADVSAGLTSFLLVLPMEVLWTPHQNGPLLENQKPSPIEWWIGTSPDL